MTATLHVIGVESDKGHSSCEQGMIELRERFQRQTTTIQYLKTELEQVTAERTQMKDKLGVMIEEGIKGKKINAEWAKSYSSLKKSTDDEIRSLKKRISDQSAILEDIRRKHADLSTMHLSGTKAYEQDIVVLQQKLRVCEKNAEQAIHTRDRAITELLKMKVRLHVVR